MKKPVSLIKVFFIIIIYLIYSLSFSIGENNNPAFFDASNYNFERDGLLSVNGLWEYYPENLLEPKDFINLNLVPKYVHIPGELSSQNYMGEGFSTEGYGTLRKVVRIKDFDVLYGLKANYLSSSNKIWVNGKLLSTSGIVATSKLDYDPKYVPREVFFIPPDEYVEIIIQISNFHHRRVRLNPIFLGKADQIQRFTYLRIIKESVLFGNLILVSFYYGVLYFIQKREKAALYLALMSLFSSMRTIVVSERVLIRLLPQLSGEFMMKLGYLPVFVLLPLSFIYVKELFKDIENTKSINVLKAIVVSSILLIGLTPLKVYDLVFEYGQYLLIIYAIYVIGIIGTKEVYTKSKGYKLMLLAGFILFITALNDLLREFDIINSLEMFSFGVVVFISIQALFLAWRFNASYRQSRKLADENRFMYEKIQHMNQDLEQKIKERTLQLEVLNKKLEKTSNLDPLTGLYNRRYFEMRFQQEWNRALRNNLPISVLMIDIDCFKEFNDNYGHLKGDECLISVANELSLSIHRSSDLVARYGGEEFIVLLPETDSKGALVISEKIRTSIEDLKITHEFSQVSSVVTVSVGINTVFVTDDTCKSEFIDQADKCLYVAKHNGRNLVESST